MTALPSSLKKPFSLSLRVPALSRNPGEPRDGRPSRNDEADDVLPGCQRKVVRHARRARAQGVAERIPLFLRDEPGARDEDRDRALWS